MDSKDTLLLLVKGIVFDLPPGEQQKVTAAVEKIQAIVDEDYVHGCLALSIVSLNCEKTFPATE